MNLVLLCVGSVFLARYLERRMRVASIAHSVLFIVLAFLFLFNSGFAIIDQAMINIVGEMYFYEFQEAIRSAEIFYGVAFSTLFVLEYTNYLILSIVTIIWLVKGFKKLIQKFRIKHLKLLCKNYIFEEEANNVNEVNSQGTYLLLAHLRN